MKLRIVFKEHVMLKASEEIYKRAAQELYHLDEPNKIKRNVHLRYKGKTRLHQEKNFFSRLIMCNKDLCRSTLSADMSTDMSTESRSTSSDTSPPLGRYFEFTDTRPALRSFCQLLILSSIFSTQLLNNLF